MIVVLNYKFLNVVRWLKQPGFLVENQPQPKCSANLPAQLVNIWLKIWEFYMLDFRCKGILCKFLRCGCHHSCVLDPCVSGIFGCFPLVFLRDCFAKSSLGERKKKANGSRSSPPPLSSACCWWGFNKRAYTAVIRAPCMSQFRIEGWGSR